MILSFLGHTTLTLHENTVTRQLRTTDAKVLIIARGHKVYTLASLLMRRTQTQ